MSSFDERRKEFDERRKEFNRSFKEREEEFNQDWKRTERFGFLITTTILIVGLGFIGFVIWVIVMIMQFFGVV